MPNDDRDDNYRQTLPRLRPNTHALTPLEMEKAQMVAVGNETVFYKGYAAGQLEIDSGPLRGWTIDTELSTREGLVLEKAGEIKVAYRGTDWHNVQDIVTDAATLGGMEEHVSQLRSGKQQLLEIHQKYGVLPSELLGYSKGGAHALELGDQFKIKSTTFNPLIGRKQLLSMSATPHTVIRTLEDPVSSLLALSKKKNYTVKAIDPIFGRGDPIVVHDLKHFVEAGPRQPGGIESLMVEKVRKGQILAHYETLDAMKSGIEAGKTFTESLDQFNRKSSGAPQRQDVTEEGRLGPRIHKNSGTVKYWKESGGSFTPNEQESLRTNQTPPPKEWSAEAHAMGVVNDLTDHQIKWVNSMTPQERKYFLRAEHAQFEAHDSKITAAVTPHQQRLRSIMPKTSSLATGAVGAFASHALMQQIDPQHRFNRVASEALEGAGAGAASVGIASSLGASAALFPEMVAGGSAYMAGSESSRAISEGLRDAGWNESDAELFGNVSGGAIGGSTAAVVGAGMSAMGAMAMGSEMGAALGVVGGPMGVGLGIVAGAGIGASLGALGSLFAHHSNGTEPPPPPVYDMDVSDGTALRPGGSVEQGVHAGERENEAQLRRDTLLAQDPTQISLFSDSNSNTQLPTHQRQRQRTEFATGSSIPKRQNRRVRP